MAEPLCKIARKNGGEVPLDCLFGCPHNCFVDYTPGIPRVTQCKRCGSTDVRWRQQGGKWVLFSLQPGVEHRCPIQDDFEDLTK